MDQDQLDEAGGPAAPRAAGPARRRQAQLAWAWAGTVLVGASWLAHDLVDQQRTLPVLAVGAGWLAAAALTVQRRALATLCAMTALAWLAPMLLPSSVMWHRGPLVHLLLSGAAAWPRTRVGQATVVGAYVGAALTWPWAGAGTAAALSVLLLVSAVLERARQPVSLLRLGPWRWATALTAACLAVPPVLGAVGAGREQALVVLMGYALGLLVIAVLVVLAARPWAPPWATDLAVDLGPAPRERLERTLAVTRGDPVQLRHEADLALQAAARLRARLAEEQEDLTRTLTETQRSRRRLDDADRLERRELRRELDEVTVVRLQRLAAMLASGAAAGEGEERAPDTPEARALVHLASAVRDLDALGQGLAPAALAGGLDQALRRLAVVSAVPVDLEMPRPEAADTLPAPVRECVYYVAAEALANVARHADAGRVRLALRTLGEDGVELLLEDDGVGSPTGTNGTGLSSMRERAADLGGRVEIVSDQGRGTRVRLTLPGADGTAT